jgi:hypothetical protein
MPELTIHLVNQGTSQSFNKAEVRLGRDLGCDVVFQSEEFPMVGRQHAVLRADGAGWSVEDLQSTNGTFVNQARVQRQLLAPGDTLRLGSDGPEVRVQFVDEAGMQVTRPAALAAAAGVVVTQASAPQPSEVPPAAQNAAAALVGAQLPATMLSELPPTRPVVAATIPSLAPTKPSSRKYGPSVSEDANAPEENIEPEDSSVVAAQEQQEQISEEEDPMNEQRLSLLRNLAILMVMLVLVLGGIVMQQIADIKRNVLDMRADANNAVSKFQPDLDKRLKKMETNMDAVNDQIQKAPDMLDDRMKKSQADFMAQLDKQLPKMLDKYLDQKKGELLSGAAVGKLPH